jgi:hypothetical protein
MMGGVRCVWWVAGTDVTSFIAASEASHRRSSKIEEQSARLGAYYRNRGASVQLRPQAKLNTSQAQVDIALAYRIGSAH